MKYIYDKQTKYAVSLLDMEIAHQNVLNGAEECVFITEHEGVYSAGKSFEQSDILRNLLLPIYYPKRGGRITVHSPGQIVVYPIINLRKRGLNVRDFVVMLEEWMISALSEFGIKATVSSDGIGVWVNGSKIGFVGIRIGQGVSTHGLCLNVSNDIKYFSNIIPCGISGVDITSIEKILNDKIHMEDVAQKFIKTSKL